MRTHTTTALACAVVLATPAAGQSTRVTIPSAGWELVGDLVIPAATAPVPAVLLLNKAAGDRRVYRELADRLSRRGIASLRLDLPGHGESINRGRFVPGAVEHDLMIWDADVQVAAAHEWLRQHDRIAADRIAIVGASYSGEEAVETARTVRRAAAYVTLSPGSLSDESIDDLDAHGDRWLYVASRQEPHLQEVTASVATRAPSAEMWLLPGTGHATRLLEGNPSLTERLAVWLAATLQETVGGS